MAKTKWHTANPVANNTARRFFLSVANKMNAKQGGMVSRRMTYVLAFPV